MTLLQRLARGLGYDLTLRKKARPHEAQLAADRAADAPYR